MTVSEHVYTASVGGLTLAVRGGKLTLDSAAFPHVKGDLVTDIPGVWVEETVENPLGGDDLIVPRWEPSPEVLTALDPRVSPAPRVHVTATDGAVSRTFDLHVRDRSIDHREGTATLILASDEALLDDYGPLGDDNAPYALAGSVRAVCNYVLGKVLPGTTLQASPSVDEDVSPYWAVTNQVVNAACDNAVGYVAGANSSGVNFESSPGTPFLGTAYGWWRAPAAGPSYTNVSGALRVSPGDSVVASARFQRGSGDAQKPCHILIRFVDAQGNIVRDEGGPGVTLSTVNVWTRVSHIVTAPPGAVTAYMYLGMTTTAANDAIRFDAPMLYADTELVPEFSGSTAADGRYTYSYSGAAGNSPSTRKPVVDRPRDALRWRAGTSAMEFLHPLLQAKGLRLVCDEQRRWTLRTEDFTTGTGITLRHAVNLISAEEAISRDGGFWFDARATRYRWTDDAGVQQERVDAYALTPNYTCMSTVDVDAVYPGPGRSEYAVRRAQGVGREVTVSTVPQWAVAAESPLQLLLDDTPPQVANVRAVAFDLDNDEMTITARTVDTPVGAINLLTGIINALPGTINALH